MARIQRLVGRIGMGLAVLCAILLIGTVGYQQLEGWAWHEAAYVTLLIISTLGFGKLTPLTQAGQGLTVFLIIGGVGTLFYLLSNAAETIIETSLGVTRARRMERTIAQLKNHHIICGFGRVGHYVAQELAAQEQAFVIIDPSAEVVEQARSDGWAAIEGNATEDAVLQLAGVERASGLLLTTGSDATNVFIALTARMYNTELVIVARASHERSISKLEHAGANKVIAPEMLGGQRMASFLLRPGATEVIDTLLQAEDSDNWLEQTTVPANSPLCGKSLQATQLHQRTGVQVIAIRRADGSHVTNPTGDTVLLADDILVSVGAADELAKLAVIAESPSKSSQKPASQPLHANQRGQ